jgi:hypothetical protein
VLWNQVRSASLRINPSDVDIRRAVEAAAGVGSGAGVPVE